MSRCCRVAQRPLISAQDSVYITDQHLSDALDRFCRLSLRPRRWGSHVPGPLESRRRLGRRQMGLETLQTSPTLSPWALPSPTDMSKWRWSPPSQRPAEHPTPQAGAETAKLPAKPSAQSVLGELFEQLFEEPAEESAADTRPEVPVMETSIKGGSFFAELESLRAHLASAPPTEARRRLRNLCSHLQQDLELGFVDVRDAVGRYETMADLVQEKFAASRLGLELYGEFTMAIAERLPLSSADGNDRLDHQFWTEALHRLESYPISWMTFLVFDSILKNAPQTSLTRLETSIITHTQRFMDYWSSDEVPQVSMCLEAVQKLQTTPPQWPPQISRFLQSDATGDVLDLSKLKTAVQSARRNLGVAAAQVRRALSPRLLQIQRVAYALRQIESSDLERLVQAVNNSISGTDMPSGSADRLRQAWLTLLARLALPRGLFYASCIQLDSSQDIAPMPSSEISTVLLSHWEARGYMGRANKARDLYKQLALQHPEVALANLALCVWKTETGSQRWHRMAVLLRFIKNLDRTGELLDALDGLNRLSPRIVPLGLLKMLTHLAREHKLALDIHAIAAKYFSHPADGLSPKAWAPHLKSILMDPTCGAGAVWRALGIDPQLNRRSVDPDLRPLLHRPQAQILERMTVLLPEAAHMSDRAIWRHLCHCVGMLLSRREGLNPRILHDVYAVLSRDIKRGTVGAPVRFKWWLRILKRQYGSTVADACEFEWKRMRRAIRLMDRYKYGRLQKWR